jgi:hypothetical protein
VWDIVEPHIHAVPDPNTSPTVGITGLETFISLTPPAPITDAIVSPVTGNVLTAEIKVAEVHVDWGDGATDNFPEITFPNLTDYPDGIIRHEYQTKTCAAPGASASCHPSLAAYPITVSYEWFVHWRVNSEPWNILTIPDTLTILSYDVDEIISRNVARNQTREASGLPLLPLTSFGRSSPGRTERLSFPAGEGGTGAAGDGRGEVGTRFERLLGSPSSPWRT